MDDKDKEMNRGVAIKRTFAAIIVIALVGGALAMRNAYSGYTDTSGFRPKPIKTRATIEQQIADLKANKKLTPAQRNFGLAMANMELRNAKQ